MRPETDAPWRVDDAALLPDLLVRTGVPGAAAVVLDRGRVVQHLVAGTRDRTTGAPMTADTVTEAASLGKPVFAWAVLRLVAAGRLDLDRPLADYAAPPDLAPAARAVTARHVLSHTTGFPNWRSGTEPLAPAFTPGARFRYSGEGFYWLQRVVERVTGRPAARWMDDTVFAPLGMARSSYVWRPAFEADHARPHGARPDAPPGEGNADTGRRFLDVEARVGRALRDWTVDDAGRGHALAFPGHPPVLPAMHQPNVAATLFTTAGDYARFLAAALAPREGGTAAMWTPQVRLGPALAFGLGWGLEGPDGARGAVRRAWHWGDNGGFRNFVLADAARGRAVAVFTNGESGYKVYDRLVRASTRAEHDALLFWMAG
jgi:CubicO group peptidase (beta-lactamase class C family)